MADELQHNDQQFQDPEVQQILAGIALDLQQMDNEMTAARTQVENLTRATACDARAMTRLEEHVSGKYLASLIENEERRRFFDDPKKVKEAYRRELRAQQKPRPRRKP